MANETKMVELNREEASMLEINAALAIAKLRTDDGLTINVTRNYPQPPPPPAPASNPLGTLCEAALAEAGVRASRRPRMRFTNLEKKRLVELAEGLGWEWGSGSEREAGRAGVARFCAERPGRVGVRQFVGWMARNRRKYQRVKPGRLSK